MNTKRCALLAGLALAVSVSTSGAGRAAPAVDRDPPEPGPWVKKAFVILKSTASYDDARALAVAAAKKLGSKLDLRDLSPNKKLGLTFPKRVCEEDSQEFPCYWPRGRWDDGVYVSVEYSTGYQGFKPGLYIVIFANGEKEDDGMKAALRRARAIYPDAYAKTTSVYLGCMH